MFKTIYKYVDMKPLSQLGVFLWLSADDQEGTSSSIKGSN